MRIGPMRLYQCSAEDSIHHWPRAFVATWGHRGSPRRFPPVLTVSLRKVKRILTIPTRRFANASLQCKVCPTAKRQGLICPLSPCSETPTGSKLTSSVHRRMSLQLRCCSWWLGRKLDGRSGPQLGRPTLGNMRKFLLETPHVPSPSFPRTSMHFHTALENPMVKTLHRRNAANKPLLRWASPSP